MRVIARNTLMCLAYPTFIISLFLPVLPSLLWKSSPMTGWSCLVCAQYYYPSNALFLISPVLFFVMRRVRRRLHVPLLALFWASFIFVTLAPIVYRLGGYPDPSGFYVWASAHGALAAAFTLQAFNHPKAVNEQRGFDVLLSPSQIITLDPAHAVNEHPVNVSLDPLMADDRTKVSEAK